MSDYPKVIEVGGVKYTVDSAEEEARWQQSQPEPAPEPEDVKSEPEAALKAEPEAEPGQKPSEEPKPAPKPDPLDDISVEMDNPAFDAPKKKSASKKK